MNKGLSALHPLQSGPRCWMVMFIGLMAAASSRAVAPAHHLFLDPATVRHFEPAALHVNPPRSREIVIRPGQPWEQLMISLFLTVRYEGGKLIQ